MNDFIEKIKHIELPGEQSHLKMAPASRQISSLARKESANYKESGVAIILFEKNKNLHLVLIQRPTYDGAHSGQISFPGGKKELTDANLYETAVRECKEEIGVELSAENYIRELTPVFIPVSNFHVEVHLFFVKDEPTFITDRREVAFVFDISLDELLEETRIKYKDIQISASYNLKNVPYFEIDDKVIWGATALMLSELKEVFVGLAYGL